MRYVTAAGIVLEIGRVERRLLDDLAWPEPQPPTRAVETWGGVTEQVPVYDDPGYLAELRKTRVKFWRENLRVIAPLINLPDDDEIAALRALEIAAGDAADYLRFKVAPADQEKIVGLVYYLSTVTARGITEAEQRFGYTWRGKPLSAWPASYTHGARGQMAVDYHAALRSGLTWAQFCALSGPEQSALVAFWNSEDRLTWLMLNAK